jgi:hypothetical protein
VVGHVPAIIPIPRDSDRDAGPMTTGRLAP